MNSLAIGTAAVATSKTPFATGFNCVAVNFTAAAIVLSGSDTSGGTYTAIVTVPAGGMIDVPNLTPFVKAASASVYLLG